MIPIKIVSIPIEDVLRYDKTRYNTNNYWTIEERPRPDDYPEVQNKCNTKNWIHRFHKPESYHIFRLDKEDLEWMAKAQVIGRMTHEFSKLYEEELEETLEKYKDTFPKSNFDEYEESRILKYFPKEIKKGCWFIRTERVSLKNGQFGTGPYNDLEKIIKSLVTSNPGHECFKPEEDEYLDLYFLPFLKGVDVMKEFRVFIYQGNITAISVQALYSRNLWMMKMTDKERSKIVYKILDHYSKEIKPKMEGYLDSYTMDLALIGEDLEPYFIEPNSFGADYAAGAALFDWKLDHDTLHDPSFIEFRYTVYPNLDED